MSTCLFISHVPLSSSRNNSIVPLCYSKLPRRIATRTRRILINACTKSPSSSQPEGEEEWMNMAKSIGSGSESSDVEPQRASPQWTYPEGDLNDVGENNPWELWNTTQKKSSEEKLKERDIAAETDFWRNTAKDIVPENQEESLNSMPVEEMTDTEQIWKMARGITGNMTNLQNELLTELNEYNPAEKSDEYRDAAREIIDDKQSRDSNNNYKNEDVKGQVQGEAQAGTGWNPDVDWMRFDDVNRENSLVEESEKRKIIENQAKQSMQQKLDSVNNNANDSDSVNSISTSTPDNFTVNGELPGFIKNRLRKSGTYGGDRYGAKDQTEELIKEGFEIRDPKSDAASWRSTAKDIIEDIPQVTEAEQEETTKVEQLEEEEEKEEIKFEENVEDNSSAWSSWYEGSIRWNQANKKIKERDPKQEVDMWRSSARDLVGKNTTESSSSTSSTSTDNDPNNEESNAWSQWRTANAKWETSIENDDLEDDGRENMNFQNNEKVDWGAGLGKTNSERNAWENWNRVMSSKTNGNDGKMWWNTRWDGNSIGNKQVPSSDIDFLRTDTVVDGERVERLESNSTVDEWRSIAKKISNNDDNNDDINNDNNEKSNVE